jgi:TPR repeat protein
MNLHPKGSLFLTFVLSATMPWAFAAEDIAALRLRAERGEPAAQVRLAECYERGESVSQDFVAAEKLFRSAAAQGVGQPFAMTREIFRNMPARYPDERSWWEAAAKQGNAYAQFRLGLSYDQPLPGVGSDQDQALMWLKKSASQNCAEGLFALSFIEKDKQKSLAYLKQAADAGNLEAMTAFADYLLVEKKEQSQADFDEGVRLLQSAESKGSSYALHRLAQVFSSLNPATGFGSPSDRVLANKSAFAKSPKDYFKLLRRDALRKESNSAFEMSVIYSNGWKAAEIEADPVAAYGWSLFAVLSEFPDRAGSPSSCLQGLIGGERASPKWPGEALRRDGQAYYEKLRHESRTSRVDDVEARLWFNLHFNLAALGKGDNEFRIAQFYFRGEGVSPDPEKAFKMWTANANKGHAGSIYAAAWCLLHGEGTPKDEAAARAWFAKLNTSNDPYKIFTKRVDQALEYHTLTRGPAGK